MYSLIPYHKASFQFSHPTDQPIKGFATSFDTKTSNDPFCYSRVNSQIRLSFWVKSMTAFSPPTSFFFISRHEPDTLDPQQSMSQQPSSQAQSKICPLETEATVKICKTSTTSANSHLLLSWSLERFGTNTAYIFESQLSRSREIADDAFRYAEKEEKQAYTTHLDADTFSRISHWAALSLAKGTRTDALRTQALNNLLKYHKNLCNTIRTALGTVLATKIKEARGESRFAPFHMISCVDPDEWGPFTNGDYQGDRITKLSRCKPASKATLKVCEVMAERVEDLKRVEGMSFCWRQADGSLLWMAGDELPVSQISDQEAGQEDKSTSLPLQDHEEPTIRSLSPQPNWEEMFAPLQKYLGTGL